MSQKTTPKPQAYKVRDGYRYMKNGKPSDLKVVPADDPDLEGQMHKVEPLEGEAAKAATVARDIQVRAQDIERLGGLSRDALIDLYKEHLKQDPPDGITKRELTKALRTKFAEALEEALEADKNLE